MKLIKLLLNISIISLHSIKSVCKLNVVIKSILIRRDAFQSVFVFPLPKVGVWVGVELGDCWEEVFWEPITELELGLAFDPKPVCELDSVLVTGHTWFTFPKIKVPPEMLPIVSELILATIRSHPFIDEEIEYTLTYV